MKKRVISAFMIVALTATLVLAGCSSESGSSSSDDGGSEKTDKKIKIGYLAMMFSIQWMQDMDIALEDLCEQRGWEYVSADAQASSETQMSQLDTFINEDVSGVVTLITDLGGSGAMAARCEEAGIPLIGESEPLETDDGTYVAPMVELNAEECAEMAVQWVADHHDDVGVSFEDESKVGLVTIRHSGMPNNVRRAVAAEAMWNELFPKSKVFAGDVAADSDSGKATEGSFDIMAAYITANPDITTWICIPSVEDYGVGALRAIEDKGFENSSMVVGIGGERAREEWDTGVSKAWYASVYYDAYSCAELVIEGFEKMLVDGVDAEELWSENREDGQSYSKAKFAGEMITPDNYKDVVREIK